MYNVRHRCINEIMIHTIACCWSLKFIWTFAVNNAVLVWSIQRTCTYLGIIFHIIITAPKVRVWKIRQTQNAPNGLHDKIILKGHSHEIFEVVFQPTASPGSIRDALRPFQIALVCAELFKFEVDSKTLVTPGSHDSSVSQEPQCHAFLNLETCLITIITL